MTAILGALKYLPATVARKALEKVDPKFGNYFSRAISYGFDVDRAIDYLADRFQTDAQKQHKQQLEQGAANRTLRPDEMVSRSEIANAELPFKALKTAASFATGGLLGGLGQGQPQPQQMEAPQQTMPQERIQQPQNAKEAVRQYNARPKPQQPIAQRLEEQFDRGYGVINPPAEKDTFYRKAFNALKNGRAEVEGRREQFLVQARPHYENGQIKSPEDLKDFHELLYAKRQEEGRQGQQGQQGQGKQQFLQGINQLAQTLQSLRQR